MSDSPKTPPQSSGEEFLWDQSLGPKIGPTWQIGDIVEHRWFVHRIRPPSAMGIIYFCFDMTLGLPVVAKSLPPQCLVSRRPRERFASECKLWVSFGSHPNIVRAFFVEQLQSVPYIFVEWVAGVDSYRASVADWIESGGLRVDDAIRIGADVCEGFIHIANQLGPASANFAHRDVKPSNILLNEHGVAKLTDFGLALIIQESGFGTAQGRARVNKRPEFAHVGEVAGTPPYMAPEQCRRGDIVDRRSDIYSFGCVLYEMLTGRRLFEVSAQSEWLDAHQKLAPPTLEACPDVPSSLRALVASCLEKDPRKRPQTFAEVKGELETTGHRSRPRRAAATILDQANEWMDRGSSLDSLGQPVEALECFAEAERLIEGSPSDNDLKYSLAYNRAIALEHAGRFDDALREWDHTISLFTDITTSGKSLRGSLPISKGYLFVEKSKTLNRMRRTDEAVSLCKEALRWEPGLYEAISSLGAAYSFGERWNEAIHWCDRALAIQPNDYHVLTNKALALCGLGRNAESLVWYDRALALAPAHPESLYGKGTVLLFEQQLDEAALWLRKAVDANPRYSLAWNHLGIALLKAGKPGAEDCFAKAIEIDPSNVTALRNLAEASSRNFVRTIMEAVSSGGGTIEVSEFAVTEEFFETLDRYLDWFCKQTGQELFFIRRLIPQLREVRLLGASSVAVVVSAERTRNGLEVNARIGFGPSTTK